jgi:hypothetical protein
MMREAPGLDTKALMEKFRNEYKAKWIGNCEIVEVN